MRRRLQYIQLCIGRYGSLDKLVSGLLSQSLIVEFKRKKNNQRVQSRSSPKKNLTTVNMYKEYDKEDVVSVRLLTRPYARVVVCVNMRARVL